MPPTCTVITTTYLLAMLDPAPIEAGRALLVLLTSVSHSFKHRICCYNLDLLRNKRLSIQVQLYTKYYYCSDGTICPFPKNQTCSDKHQGITEINYHNDNPLPSHEANLAIHYSAAGYSISVPTTTPAAQIVSATETLPM